MKIKWLGHSSFLITSDEEVRIITDPYATGGGIDYARIAEAADIVVTSHQHRDHNAVSQVKGNPTVVKETGSKEIKHIEFTGISSYHDDAKGKQRGPNTIFCFTVDGIMHYKTSKCTYPIADVEEFLKGKQNIRRLESSEVEFKKEKLPPSTQIVILKHEK